METRKLDDYTLEVTETISVAPVTKKTSYDRSFIETQIEQITKQRDKQIADLQADKERELKKCQDILTEMDKLEIISRPVETNPIETIK